ncbi:porin [Achromobacter anxifer]
MKKNAAFLMAMSMSGLLIGSSKAIAQPVMFGVLDVALDISNQGAGTVARMQSGGEWGSRLGMRGTEKISDDLAAVYWMESGFGVHNGKLQQGGRLFGRQVFVGLSSERYGSLTFGRQYSPENRMFWNIDAFNAGLAGGLPSIIPAGEARATLGRVDNSMFWASPKRWPVTVYALYAPGDAAGIDRAGKTWSLATRLKNETVDLNIGFVTRHNESDTGRMQAFTTGGNYTLGALTLFAGWHRDWNSDANRSGKRKPELIYDMFPLGARYRVDLRWTLIAQAVLVQDRSRDLPDKSTNLLAVGANYDLSKRTVLYAAAGRILNRNGSQFSLGGGLYAGGPVGSGDPVGRTVQLGLRHSF